MRILYYYFKCQQFFNYDKSRQRRQAQLFNFGLLPYSIHLYKVFIIKIGDCWSFIQQKNYFYASFVQFFSQVKQKRQMKSDLFDAQSELNLQNNDMADSSDNLESFERNRDMNQEIVFDDPKIIRKEKNYLEGSEVNGLYQKKQKLQQFIQLIGEYSIQPIRFDILQHCQKVSINIPPNMSKETVTKLVRGRVQKMIKNKRIKKNWSEQDLKILVWVISKYCQYHGIFDVRQGMTEADWNNIANIIPGVSGKSCMFKWLSLKKNNLADNGWAQEQSLLLDQMVKQYGQNSWCRVSQQLFLRNNLANKIYRCPKQCREHWNCYLNPQLKKGPWDKKQDYLLLRSVMQLEGVKKWAEIVKMFNGRTQNALKNRFNLIIQKQLKQFKKCKKPTELQIIGNYLKKHDKEFEVGEQTLKFLSDKRNIINENQSKKQPKKNKVKKVPMKLNYDYDNYMPNNDDQWRIYKQTRSCKIKSRLTQSSEKSFQQKKQEFCCKNESIMNSVIDRKNSAIFQYQQYEEEMVKIQQQKQVPKTPDVWMHTSGQNISIQHSGVYFVPFSQQLFSKIKNHILIPCKITEAKQIIQLPL